MNYYDIKDTVQNLVAHVGELDEKLKEVSKVALNSIYGKKQAALEAKIDQIIARLTELEAEAYDADKVKSAIKELRSELIIAQQDPTYTPYFIVKLEDSQ